MAESSDEKSGEIAPVRDQSLDDTKILEREKMIEALFVSESSFKVPPSSSTAAAHCVKVVSYCWVVLQKAQELSQKEREEKFESFIAVIHAHAHAHTVLVH